MNRKRVEELLPKAYEVLAGTKIAVKGEINKAFRGQISSFGAAMNNGSLLAAIAFFSQKGAAKVDRTFLMVAIAQLTGMGKDPKDLFAYVQKEIERKREKTCREEILNACIALKLAMNLYRLIDENDKG